MGRFRAYLQLVRLPALFSAWGDIWLGYLATHTHLLPVHEVALLMLSTTGLYLGGMAFNDYFDREVDARERPNRPIPSGAVSASSAFKIATGLTVIGVLATVPLGTRSLMIALAIVLCVLGYNSKFKSTSLGPLVMAACRFLNILLGASLVSWEGNSGIFNVAALMGAYIFMLTWFGKNEAEESSPKLLKMATGGLILVWLVMGAYLFYEKMIGPNSPDLYSRAGAAVGVGVIAVIVLRKILPAISSPGPAQVQSAMRSLLMAILLLDAMLILGTNGCWGYTVAALCLMIPARLIGRQLYVT